MKCPASQPSSIFAAAAARSAERRLPCFRQKPFWIDFLIAAMAMGIYLLWIYKFRYRGLLGEDDLYRMLVGLLDGARSGAHLASANQYGKAFSFGYIAAVDRFAGPRVLADPERLMALINEIGFWAAAAGCCCFWLLAWLLNGLRSATVAVLLFALSPMMLELGTSGHPILPAFAFFAAGAVCLLLPASGARSIPLAVLGSLLLLAALATRAEVILAFPFLVLGRADFCSLPRFLKCAGRRAIAPALAAAAFFALKRICVDSTPGTGRLGPFLERFIRLKEIPVGVLVFIFCCGMATTIVGLVAFGRLVRACKAAPAAQRAEFLSFAIGPSLLIVAPLAFWLADPRPGRHFILCLAGISMLIGWLISQHAPARPLLGYALVVGIVLSNQALGALTGPVILRYAPSKIVALPGGVRHLPRGFPTGSSWSYHRAFVAEQLKTSAFAKRVEGACDDKTLVLSLDATQIFSGLYRESNPWNAEEREFHHFPVLTARIGGRTILVLSENEGWPGDAAADALAEPAFSGYKLVRDPNNISIYDHAIIPPSRIARLDCAP